MRILADECVDSLLVGWLREEGHDVEWAAESDRGAHDEVLAERAERENRVIVTEDKDFGELVHSSRLKVPGVVLLRVSCPSRQEYLSVFRRVWPQAADRVIGHFVVVTRDRIRVRTLPPLTLSGE